MDDYVPVSAGLEDVKDVVADFEQAPAAPQEQVVQFP